VTPLQVLLAGKVSKEMGSVKLTLLMAQLCHAIDSELTENYHLRIGCREDCRERGHAFSPRLGEGLPGMNSHSAERHPARTFSALSAPSFIEKL